MKGRTEKVSINTCRIILKKYGHDYSDEEIEKIRDFLYILGEIEYGHYLKTYNENSNHICSGINR